MTALDYLEVCIESFAAAAAPPDSIGVSASNLRTFRLRRVDQALLRAVTGRITEGRWPNLEIVTVGALRSGPAALRAKKQDKTALLAALKARGGRWTESTAEIGTITYRRVTEA